MDILSSIFFYLRYIPPYRLPTFNTVPSPRRSKGTIGPRVDREAANQTSIPVPCHYAATNGKLHVKYVGPGSFRRQMHQLPVCHDSISVELVQVYTK